MIVRRTFLTRLGGGHFFLVGRLVAYVMSHSYARKVAPERKLILGSVDFQIDQRERNNPGVVRCGIVMYR